MESSIVTTQSVGSYPTTMNFSIDTIANEILSRILQKVTFTPEKFNNLKLVNKRFRDTMVLSSFRFAIIKQGYPELAAINDLVVNHITAQTFTNYTQYQQGVLTAVQKLKQSDAKQETGEILKKGLYIFDYLSKVSDGRPLVTTKNVVVFKESILAKATLDARTTLA